MHFSHFVTGIFAFSLLVTTLPVTSAMRWPPDDGTAVKTQATAVTGRPAVHRARRNSTNAFMYDKDYYRNQQRKDDVKAIANLIYQYKLDHDFNGPQSIPIKKTIELCQLGATGCKGLLDLGTEIGSYAEKLPVDPQARQTGASTRYFITRDFKDKVTVSAPDAELGWIINFSR